MKTPSHKQLKVWAAKYALHVALLFASLILAYAARRGTTITWWLTSPDALRVLGWAVLYSGVGGSVELVFQSERAAWRYASVRDAIGLVRNVTVSVSLFLGLIFVLDRGILLPRSVLPLTWLISIAMLIGARLAWRLPHDPGLAAHFLPTWWPKQPNGKSPLIAVGATTGVERQLRLLQADARSPYQAVGVVTPNPGEVGTRVHGVPFLTTLDAWKANIGVIPGRRNESHAILFVDDPVVDFKLTVEQIGELRRAGHKLLKPQALADMGQSNILEEIPVEDFLSRKPVSLSRDPLLNLVSGRRVLVTGAGGSIGAEICRQLLSLGCSHLTLVDHSEFLLFEIDRELRRVKSQGERSTRLANVRDYDRVSEVIREAKPDIIFHAAALKHVGLVEANPSEGVLTNVLGTRNVLRAALANEVSEFVLISTDKAVAPTNVMGATKRLAEALLDMAPAGGTQLTAVRFGNVLGSAGSVVPIFRDQIARGGPVTVTHPDVNRFFMTIPEAVELVLHSAALGREGESRMPRKFILEMGEPVKIVDLARQMIELSGQIPEVDIAIEFTGLTPGEKLSEVLNDAGERTQPCAEGIVEIQWDAQSTASVEGDVQTIIDLAGSASPDLRSAVMSTVERLRGAGSIN